MVHWGLVISTGVLGSALFVGVIGAWGASGTVMWMERVAFAGVLYGTILSLIVRRRDAVKPEEADSPRE